eukprot:CAMPEP_0206480524 /NCGR_PEP_ID=MMETSP0324_2-20121206/37412_1 /ASSEMBLY_ACC=CAM_ASM_000836 /TAXON_ID=2866 /ORGANISM="Crypthecodinium cohnii, Strain Seligo" /LENGTH=190 /DNA_ID=CAMNT_0053957461 /DNA_START=1006 /DNA_END=1578 /DNA_ORIENTATION=-
MATADSSAVWPEEILRNGDWAVRNKGDPSETQLVVKAELTGLQGSSARRAVKRACVLMTREAWLEGHASAGDVERGHTTNEELEWLLTGLSASEPSDTGRLAAAAPLVSASFTGLAILSSNMRPCNIKSSSSATVVVPSQPPGEWANSMSEWVLPQLSSSSRASARLPELLFLQSVAAAASRDCHMPPRL